MLIRMHRRFLILSVCLYLGGAVVYVSKVPECCLPGRMDYVGNSHQVWHLFVLCAALCHYAFLMTMADAGWPVCDTGIA